MTATDDVSTDTNDFGDAPLPKLRDVAARHRKASAKSAALSEQHETAAEAGLRHGQMRRVLIAWVGRGEASLSQIEERLTTARWPPAVDQMPHCARFFFNGERKRKKIPTLRK